jgi:hypothetical protein
LVVSKSSPDESYPACVLCCSITTLWRTAFPYGAAVLTPPVLVTDGGVFVGVHTQGGEQVVIGADGRTGEALEGGLSAPPSVLASTAVGAGATTAEDRWIDVAVLREKERQQQHRWLMMSTACSQCL